MNYPAANDEYSFNKPRRQVFALPYGFTNHIFKNYTPHVYWKLAMTCKQFFGQKRLIVDKSLRSASVFGGNCAYFLDYDKPISLDSMKHNKTKLWITEYCEFKEPFKTAASGILKYFYRFYGFIIKMKGQDLTFEEYMFYVKSKNSEDVFLWDITVKNPDGSLVLAKNLLKPLCGVKFLYL